MKDYKNILEGVINIINTTEKSDIGFANICTYIGENCPELAESEDERIRKAMIDFFKHERKEGIAVLHYGVNIERMIAWLEKQGEKAKYHDICDKCVRQPTCQSDCFLQQDEQKPADKVEQKFHEGDWVFIEEVKGYKNGPFQIKTVDSFGYSFDEYHTIPFMYENLLSKWTIQEAKDGDVLYDGHKACIFRKKMEDDDAIWVDTYCGINIDEEFTVNNEDECWCLACDCAPATKEQRDTLMKAMADAGYSFDFEKKELKKIEHKPADLPKGKDYGIDGLYHAIRILEDTLGKVDGYQTDDGILEHKCAINAVKELYEQKYAWSEEDEERLQSCLNILQAKGLMGVTETVNTKWLKSLKDRVQPQLKQEWSEEDEIALGDALWCCKQAASIAKDENDMGNAWYAEHWLKSLRPQNRWKPSDEDKR